MPISKANNIQKVKSAITNTFVDIAAFRENKYTKIIVGLSGGLDSVVLLHSLTELKTSSDVLNGISIEAVHVNHRLQDESDNWQKFCQSFCLELGIEYHSESVSIEKHSSESLEALARVARYSVFEKYCNEETILLTAQHQDDQVETFILQLLRGAGPKGLQSMPVIKEFSDGLHVRPLLNVTRNELEDYQKHFDLKYVSDASNLDISFDRNYIRHEVLPKLYQRWPNANEKITHSVSLIRKERHILDEMLAEKYDDVLKEQFFSIDKLLSLNVPKQVVLLRYWLSKNCTKLPPTKRINEFLSQLDKRTSEHKIQIRWDDFVLQVFQDKAYLYCDFSDSQWDVLTNSEVKNSQILSLPNNYGEFSFEGSESLSLFVKFREGGESIRLPTEGFHRKLKQLFQEKGVLPWWRSRIPLLYAGDTLVSVGNLWLNADWLEMQETTDFRVIWHDRPEIFHQNS